MDRGGVGGVSDTGTIGERKASWRGARFSLLYDERFGIEWEAAVNRIKRGVRRLPVGDNMIGDRRYVVRRKVKVKEEKENERESKSTDIPCC